MTDRKNIYIEKEKTYMNPRNMSRTLHKQSARQTASGTKRLLCHTFIPALLSWLCAFSWKPTHNPEIVGFFGPPTSPSPHNLRPTLESKQVLALYVASACQMPDISRNCRQGLKHTVPTTLPPILQSHWRKLMALQDWQGSTLQEQEVFQFKCS